MSTQQEVDFTQEEWVQTRNGLKTVWNRNEEGLFQPRRAGDLPVDTSHFPDDQMALLSATQCPGHTQSCKQTWLPADFRFCPDCSNPLLPVFDKKETAWVNPGQISTLSTKLAGLKHSSLELALKNRQPDDILKADATLPKPAGDEYRYISGTFGYGAERLIAIDIRNHLFFYFEPDSQNWLPLEDRDGYVAESPFLPGNWSCVIPDPERSHVVLLATTLGLVGVRLDLPNQRIVSRLLHKNTPLAAPVLFKGKIIVPVECEGKQHILSAEANNIAETLSLTEPGTPIGSGYQPAISGMRGVIWVNSQQQLTVNFAGDSIDAKTLPWLPTLEPKFCFGPPARYGNSYWQLCFDQQEDSYCYAKLGNSVLERKHTPTPRTSSGLTHYLCSDIQSADTPWFSPGRHNEKSEIAVPLVEFKTNPMAVQVQTSQTLCVRWRSPEAMEDALTSNARFQAELVLLGEPEQQLERFTASHPWDSEVFIYDNHLWFYHPERKEIIGWSIVGNE